MNIFNKSVCLLFLSAIFIFFFRQFLLYQKLPIPSDTIIGLYHPFRDFYVKTYPNGIPFKNFLITDPVRQEFPWKNLSIQVEKKISFPLWNPYSLTGTPLLGNDQSGGFYPLNILFFIFSFPLAWSLLIIVQPILFSVFLYWYLRNHNVSNISSIFSAVIIAFCGFSTAWMEWGTIIHTALWLPLILLCIDKIISFSTLGLGTLQKKDNSISKQKYIIWIILLLFSLTSSFFAGHLQTFFYVFLTVVIYSVARVFRVGLKKDMMLLFAGVLILFLLVASIQLLPTMQFIGISARNIDQANWQQSGWFIPWQHIIQFLVPDFFGNPATLNYWGVWNYGEFIGYAGVIPLIMALYALFFSHDRKTLFFGTLFFISLLFAFPTFLAMIPYTLRVPLLSTSQPTRLLFITDFTLAVLAGLGLDLLLRKKKKDILYAVSLVGLLLFGIWVYILLITKIDNSIIVSNILIAKRNSILPSIIWLVSLVVVSLALGLPKRYFNICIICLLLLTAFDLTRFSEKFLPFTPVSYLYPQTDSISYLQNHIEDYRIMTADSEILPPNFSIMYRLQSIDGYDPLFTLRYGEFIAASERNKPDINPPFGFNRIITPHNISSPFINLLGVKYILSLKDIKSQSLQKVFQEGQTRIYENKNVLPRAFFIQNILSVDNKYQDIQLLFSQAYNLQKVAIIEGPYTNRFKQLTLGSATISSYNENEVKIQTENNGDGYLVFTDSFYPTWRAYIDQQSTVIYRTDYNFRGVYVPKGTHTIIFSDAFL